MVAASLLGVRYALLVALIPLIVNDVVSKPTKEKRKGAMESIKSLIKEHHDNPVLRAAKLPQGAVFVEDDMVMYVEDRVKEIQAIIDELEATRKQNENKSNGKGKGLNKGRGQRSAIEKRAVTILENVYEWPKSSDGKVYIKYDASAFSASEKAVIQSAISQYDDFTCIRFQEKTSSDNGYYIKLVKEGGCWSYLGNIPAGADGADYQRLSLEVGATATCVHVSVILHEFGHALGHHHEQNRPDRDTYITVLNGGSQFVQTQSHQVDLHGTPYDFRSIMHYDGVGTNFTMNQQNELEDDVGTTSTLSFYDVQAITSRYDCANGCPAASCPAGSFQAADCNCYCFSGVTDNPIVNCGEVCVSINQECNCAARTDACSGLVNTACNSVNGKCECVSGTYDVNGACKTPAEVQCSSLNANCLCSHKASDTCSNGVANSNCDAGSNTCICSGQYKEISSGTCMDTNTLPCTLGENCYCNLQTDTPCLSIAKSACDTATGACECSSGYVQLDGDTTCTDLTTLSCSVLAQDCGCGALGSNACQSLPNSECDSDSGACFCSEDFYNNNGQCTAAPSCTTLNTACHCSVQGPDACSAIDNSICQESSDQCVCVPGYQIASGMCELHADYTLAGQTIHPFSNEGSSDWIPAIVGDGNLNPANINAGYYLLATGLADSDTTSSYILDSPDLEGKWCMEIVTRHSHAEISVSVLYFGTSYTYFSIQSSDGPINWWSTYTVGMTINGASFKFRVEAKRYNSGDFWAVLDQVRIYHC